MSNGERPIGAAKGKQPITEALCPPPPPPPSVLFPYIDAAMLLGSLLPMISGS